MDADIAQIAVKTNRHHQQEGNQKYIAWIRSCLTVASGALAILVGLQKSYVPANPVFLWGLQAAWGLFCLTIATGMLVLRGEWATHFKVASKIMSREFAEMAQCRNPAEIGLWSVSPAWYDKATFIL